jgi:hypothetical protein
VGEFHATQPRARVPVCWVCDKRLYGGGRFYEYVRDEEGHLQPAHVYCAKQWIERGGGKE